MELSKERICNIKIDDCNEEYSFKDSSPLFQILQKYSQPIFLYGEGGTGKTTAIQYVLLELNQVGTTAYYLPLKLLKPAEKGDAIHKLFECMYHKELSDIYTRDNEKPIIILDGINEAPDEFKVENYFIDECYQLIDKQIRIIIVGRSKSLNKTKSGIVKSESEANETFGKSNFVYAEQQELSLDYVKEYVGVEQSNIEVKKMLQNNYNLTLFTNLKEYDVNLTIIDAYDLAKMYYNVAIKTKYVTTVNSNRNLDPKIVYHWLKYFEYECNGKMGKKWEIYCVKNGIKRDINTSIINVNLLFEKLAKFAMRGRVDLLTHEEEANYLSLIEHIGDRCFFISDKTKDYFQTLEFFNWIKGINKQNVEVKVNKCLKFLSSHNYAKHMYFTYLTTQLKEIVIVHEDAISDRILIYYHLILSNNAMDDNDLQWHAFKANEIINNQSIEELIMDQDLLPIIFDVKNSVANIAYERGNIDWSIKEFEYVENVLEYVKNFEDRILMKIYTFEGLKNIYYSINDKEKETKYLEKTIHCINEYRKHSHNVVGKINQTAKLIELYVTSDRMESARSVVHNINLLEYHKQYTEDKSRYKDVYVALLTSLCQFYVCEKTDCLDTIFQTISTIFESNVPMSEESIIDWLLNEFEINNRSVLLYKYELNCLSACATVCYFIRGNDTKRHEWDLIRVLINQQIQHQFSNSGRMTLIQALMMAAKNAEDQDEIIELYEKAFSLANTNNSKNQISQKRDIATALITAYYERLSFSTHLIQYDIDGTMRIDKNETIILDEKKNIEKIESEMWFYDPDYRYDIFEEGKIYIDSCMEQIYDVQADSDLESHRILQVSLSILFVVSKLWCTSASKFFPNQNYDKLLLLNCEIMDYTAEELMNNLYKVYILLDECFRFVCTHLDDESQEIYDIISNLLNLLKKYELKYYCLSAYDMKNYFNSGLEEKHISPDEKEKINNIINRIETIWEMSQIA